MNKTYEKGKNRTKRVGSQMSDDRNRKFDFQIIDVKKLKGDI